MLVLQFKVFNGLALLNDLFSFSQTPASLAAQKRLSRTFTKLVRERRRDAAFLQAHTAVCTPDVITVSLTRPDQDRGRSLMFLSQRLHAARLCRAPFACLVVTSYYPPPPPVFHTEVEPT